MADFQHNMPFASYIAFILMLYRNLSADIWLKFAVVNQNAYSHIYRRNDIYHS